MKSVTKFGLEDLCHHFLKKDEYLGKYSTLRLIIVCNLSPLTYLAHRALADVEAMERIMVKTGLVDLLSSLPVRSPAQQLRAWATQKNTHHRVTQILSVLGKKVTYAQARRLNDLGLSCEDLQDLRTSCKDSEVALQDRGVRSKPLRDKLSTLLKPKR